MFCIQSFFFFSLEEIIILKWVLHSQKAVSWNEKERGNVIRLGLTNALRVISLRYKDRNQTISAHTCYSTEWRDSNVLEVCACTNCGLFCGRTATLYNIIMYTLKGPPHSTTLYTYSNCLTCQKISKLCDPATPSVSRSIIAQFDFCRPHATDLPSPCLKAKFNVEEKTINAHIFAFILLSPRSPQSLAPMNSGIKNKCKNMCI